MSAPRRVPFLDLARLHASMEEDLWGAVGAVVAESAFVGGRFVADFERALASSHRMSEAVGCGSGTDALALALRAVGIGNGDEVIVPSMTFIATAEAVLQTGARPVIVDVRPADLLIDTSEVERARTKNTRAVIPVHLYGNVVEPEAIRDWSDAGLRVVEDAAQAVLAHSAGIGIGAHSAAACLSFYPGKNLGALGDAGAVLTHDAAIAARVRLLRDHGRSTKYRHDVPGYSSRLDGIQAAVLSAKLHQLGAWTDARRSRAAQYRRLLDEAPLDGVELLAWGDGAVHHLVVIRVPADRRDDLRTALSAAGIGTGIHYPMPLSQQPYLEGCSRPCPVAREAGASIISLPIDPLMSSDDVEYVVEQLRRCARRS